MEHFLWQYPSYLDKREALFKNLQKKSVPHACLLLYALSEVSVIDRKKVSHLLALGTLIGWTCTNISQWQRN